MSLPVAVRPPTGPSGIRAVAVVGRPGPDWDEDEPEFPELDGPVFLLGTCVLVDAVWAAVGEDPLSEVLGVLMPVLDDAVPGLDGQVAAGALIGALATVRPPVRCPPRRRGQLTSRILCSLRSGACRATVR